MTTNEIRKLARRWLPKGATRTLAEAKLLFLEIHPERIDTLGLSQSGIFDILVKGGWHVHALGGEPFSRAEFIDRIHTFWTVCRKGKIWRA
jgi:hypothetical protein